MAGHDRDAVLTCPNCGTAMEALSVAGHLGTPIMIDVCAACQLFWFDARESLQLSPASTLRLFRVIGDQPSRPRRPLTDRHACPRCGLSLKLVHDRQRSTSFQYRRCARGHGRLTTFFDFLREKDFIKPMPAAQLEELRRNLASIHCANCGAAISLATESACGHCGSALSVLDAHQADRLVEQLRRADRAGQPVDPALPLRLAQARRESIQATGEPEEDPGVLAALQSLARWLTRA